MPVRRGQDGDGPYYRYGSGRKYRYTSGDKASRNRAQSMAERQGRAIRASQVRRMAK